MKTPIDRYLSHRRPTVLVVGDIMCDVYLWGEVERISPEAPVPVFESMGRQQVLGGAANVAANLRALGCEVRLLGVVGADTPGRCVRELLQKQGIDDTWLLEDPGRPTTEKTRLIAHQQQMLRLDQESQTPLSSVMVARAVKFGERLMAEVDGVVCSDYCKGVCTPSLLEPLFTAARVAGRPVIVDPKVRDFARYRGATVLTPNLAEVERASGRPVNDPEMLPKAVDILLHQSRAQVHIPTRAREVYDVTGAGDTVIATFGMAMFSGFPLVEAAHLANTAAGMVVGKMGTAVVAQAELHAALQEEVVPHDRKLLQREELAVVRQYHRHRGERVVFTNGCFDLLHVGHVHYLQQARALGERLMVGLNDDASVHQLKGAGRPLVPQDERARILAALACVDYVTMFSELTPRELITLMQPDVLVKGGDYTPETVVGRNEVEAYGGRVHIVPYVIGASTTAIIDDIVERYS
jgi:D-beta-D-heptose 7-phosphate kinase/D-beta-D-heptose 1-phosphate adenosyltransferase